MDSTELDSILPSSIMSRERSDTAGSSNSFGLRERTHTGGSMDMMISASLEPAAGVQQHQQHQSQLRYSNTSPRARLGTGSGSIGGSGNKIGLSTPDTPPRVTAATHLRHTVDWIQRQPVPSCCLPYLKRVVGLKRTGSNIAINADDDFDNTNDDDDHHYGSSSSSSSAAVYCVRGLDRVVFGTTAAADCVILFGLQPPQYLWYMLSGSMCDVFQLCVDITLHLTLFPDSASLCWMSSFAVSIMARHTSHRYLVFGDYVPNYWQSLGRMYAGYSFSIVLSTVFNHVITTGVAKVSHYVAYVMTLLWTGLANYFILKRLWKMGGPKPAPPGPAAASSTSSGSSPLVTTATTTTSSSMSSP